MKQKEKKSFLSGVKWITIIIVVINVLSSIVPAIWDVVSSGFEDEMQEDYHDLQIMNVSSEIVPDGAEGTEGEGYRTYRFLVTVDNKGTYTENISNYLIYVESGDGYAYTMYEDMEEEDKLDTRVIPPGRKGVVTVYGTVSEDSTTVELFTYQTREEEPEHYVYELPESSV